MDSGKWYYEVLAPMTEEQWQEQVRLKRVERAHDYHCMMYFNGGDCLGPVYPTVEGETCKTCGFVVPHFDPVPPPDMSNAKEWKESDGDWLVWEIEGTKQDART